MRNWIFLALYLGIGFGLLTTVQDIDKHQCRPQLTNQEGEYFVVLWGIVVPAVIVILTVDPYWKWGSRSQCGKA